jgi:MFS family permease
MLLWGLISTLTGFVQNFAGMVMIRFFLGFVEAVFLPGALLILSKWYTRKELTIRNAILFCGNLIANAFSALIGAGVLPNMKGVLGHESWRWLFFIEGKTDGSRYDKIQGKLTDCCYRCHHYGHCHCRWLHPS